jgi:hypothetical protein
LLEHTPDPGAVVRELLRVAGVAGRAVVSIPNESNIDRVKRIIGRLPVLSRLLRNLAAEDNEWHLHCMNLQVLGELIEGLGRVERLRRIPSPLLPIRYVAVLRREDSDRSEDQAGPS